MKTLQNHVILFDNECPMCYAYTQTFIKTGMLDKKGREAYQNMPANICPLVDRQRAANEIALVNTLTGEVTYGIQSLFKIISHALPIFKTLFSFGPFVYLMQKFYAFISYNRKIIIPAKVKVNTTQPSFKIQYRIAYLLFTWLVTAYILTAYAHLLTRFVPLGASYREYLICGGQMFFQGIIILFYQKDNLWDYLGNMMTISFTGALLFLPMLVASHYFQINPILFILYFLMIAGLMFLEHLRRSKILNLSWVMSITWALYRLIVLVLILLF
ncbi:DUF393 domain-containing protein [Pedobacter sp. HDW13]|uniref:DUF393 domain-containing protein n=1 Tax=unclassified Pedobacter TaxID=2628915 RepID=UPI000F5AAF1D|nr:MULTISPECIES: DUF393 domain-containing protein [unclassified Pedobacter]QIL39239.1 DUF393 domain-containing protein [Pedobacter sp. HDW13]RQO65670.1 DUF393 domain-containing protein [Pedobacter sp. KBW01]